METPKAADDLFAKVVARFNLETWIPMALGTVLVWLTILSSKLDFGTGVWDPNSGLSPVRRLRPRVEDLVLRDYLVFLVATAVAGLVLAPFQFAILQAAEGYETGPATRWLLLPFRWRHRLLARRLASQSAALNKSGHDPLGARAAMAARKEKRYLPGSGKVDGGPRVMPTTFGCVLRTGEERAGSRFGIRVDIAIPRLLHQVDEKNRSILDMHRAAMELGINLAFALVVVAGAATMAFATEKVKYLLVPAAVYSLAYGCYLGAVRSADGYVHALAVLIDLHRFELLDGARLARPLDNVDEQRKFKQLCSLFDRQNAFSGLVAYQHPDRPDEEKGTSKGAAATRT
jgi:hypothetical protein